MTVPKIHSNGCNPLSSSSSSSWQCTALQRVALVLVASTLLLLRRTDPEEAQGTPNVSRKYIVDRFFTESTRNGEKLPPFVRQYCNLTGVDRWMVPENDWRRRTPAFLILGAKKGGTTGLFQSLTQGDETENPIVRGRLKELLYFIPSRFTHWIPNEEEEDGIHIPQDAMVDVAAARRDFFKQFPAAKLQRNQTLITGEATPDYILYSEFSARAILCTVPWVKVIVLLRDPVDRLFSHYNFLRDPSRKFNNGKVRNMPPFEAWVKKDIAKLTSFGVLPEDLSRLQQYMKSSTETKGWHKYQSVLDRQSMNDRPFSRSLYALQLEDWHRNMRAVGKDPKKDMRVVLSRDLTSDRGTEVVDDLFKWLGVPPFKAPEENKPDKEEGATVKKAMVTSYTSPPLQPKFRQWLEDTIFRPYNQRLYKLLGKELQGCFDTTPSSSPPAESEIKSNVPDKVDGAAAVDSSSQASDEKSLPAFIRERCDLRGVDHWMVPEGDWRRRTPSFLILGAKKGGTTGTFQTLTSHPQILRGKKKELLYFIPKRFPHWTDEEIGGKIRVGPARRDFFEQFQVNQLKNDPSLITGEATPDYILYSEYSAQAILCTVPWVKVVVLLREPIDRLFSHYNFIQDPNKSNQKLPPFEQWVNRSIEILQDFGVMPKDLSKIEEYMGSEEERKGFHRYQRVIRGPMADRPFVRSLYALQFEDWFRNLRAVGKDPKKDMRVVLSQDMKNNATAVKDLLEWLGVDVTAESFGQDANAGRRKLKEILYGRRALPSPRHSRRRRLNSTLEMKNAMVTTYTSDPITPEYKKWLESIFAPYNKRLYRVLGPEFEGVFDPS